MSLWGNKDQANNAPKYSVAGGLGVAANGKVLYNNTSSSVFVTNLAIGDFGVSANEASNTTGEGKKVAHAGWNLRKAGTGSVINITITDPGANYNTNGFITFTNGGGVGANASYTVNTKSNTVNSVTLISGGSGYVVAPTATVANATGVNSATFVVTVGGRAGRVHYETLVAGGTITNDGENVIFPQ